MSDPADLRSLNGVARRGRRNAPAIGPEAFAAAFQESLVEVLDLRTWSDNPGAEQEYLRIEREVREAVAREGDDQREIRAKLFPRLATAAGARRRRPFPRRSGRCRRDAALLAIPRPRRGLRRHHQEHDTLALTVYQIGVSLVSYRGERGNWQTTALPPRRAPARPRSRSNRSSNCWSGAAAGAAYTRRARTSSPNSRGAA